MKKGFTLVELLFDKVYKTIDIFSSVLIILLCDT